MTGYALFRGDRLVAHNMGGDARAARLHDVGQEGDVLVYIGKQDIRTYMWNTPVNTDESYWIQFSDPASKRYRVLTLIQT